jgi:hypothetical protein
MGDEERKSKKCIDLHNFDVVEWTYGEYIDEKFQECIIGMATARRAKMIACRHCTYIREIQYKD